jgi:hypothetical protein
MTDTGVVPMSDGTTTKKITGADLKTYFLNGNASTATKLATARAINGVDFDGSSAITVTAAAGTLTGTELKSTVVTSSLTSVGTLTNLNVTNPISVNSKQAVNGPAFSAYPNSGIQQTITSGTQQKVLFQQEDFDTNNNFASSRFTPTVAGYYQLNAVVRISGTMGTGESMLVIWKNGAEYKRGWNASGTEAGANFFAMGVSTLAYANGTGDYFEVYIQQGSGGNRDITVAGGNITWFNGCMMRGA